jgi:hypothetical protein
MLRKTAPFNGDPTGTGTNTRADASAPYYSLVSCVPTVLNRTTTHAAASPSLHAPLLKRIARITEKIMNWSRKHVVANAFHPNWMSLTCHAHQEHSGTESLADAKTAVCQEPIAKNQSSITNSNARAALMSSSNDAT